MLRHIGAPSLDSRGPNERIQYGPWNVSCLWGDRSENTCFARPAPARLQLNFGRNLHRERFEPPITHHRLSLVNLEIRRCRRRSRQTEP